MKHKHLRKQVIKATDTRVARGYGPIKCDGEIPKLVKVGSISRHGVVWDRLVSLSCTVLSAQ